MDGSTIIVKFTNCIILRDHDLVTEDIWVRNGKIIDPEPIFFDEKRLPDKVVDCEGFLLAPGLIDLQINGGFGVDFSRDITNPGSADACITKVASGLLKHGVTSFCPTLVTSPPSVYKEVVPCIQRRPGGKWGATVLGLHLEGPFISRQKRGAHQESYIRHLAGGFAELCAVYGGCLDNVSIITLAPELDPTGAVVRQCVARGVCVSLGHSACSLEEGEAAVNAGATLITHLFNAMTVFHHRNDPGLVGLLTSKRKKLGCHPVFYGLIADGIHTHPTALRLAVRANMKGLCAVSDAISAMGLEDGTYALGQQQIEVRGDRAVIAGTQTLCGASATVYHAVRKLRHLAWCSAVEALEAATLHPAQALGIEHIKGTLDYGADADFILLDCDSFDLHSTWIAGQCVYKVDS